MSVGFTDSEGCTASLNDEYYELNVRLDACAVAPTTSDDGDMIYFSKSFTVFDRYNVHGIKLLQNPDIQFKCSYPTSIAAIQE